MVQANLYIVQGDTVNISVTVQQNGAAYNLTGATLRMTAKYNYTDADGAAVFQLNSLPTGGIVITNAAAGQATVTVAAVVTRSLPSVLVPLYYDLQVTDSSGNIFTVAMGTLYVQPDVTITSP